MKNKWIWVRWVVLLAAVFVFFAVRNRAGISDPSWEQATMGTRCHITVPGSFSKSDLAALRERIDAALDDVNRRMSTWQPDTEISKFNAFASLEPFAVSAEFAEVVGHALQMSHDTDGAFDPTVKPLVDHWGFGPGAGEGQIDEILKAVGWRKIRLTGQTLVKSNPGVQLDLSAIAKGFGVDAVAGVIRRAGQKSFLVEIGGEIVAEGSNRSGNPWRIGIELPDPDQAFGADILEKITLSGRALATSGDYRNFHVREDGTRYSHIIDPRSGMPSESDVASVSVLADTCMDADAAATALFVMGSEKGILWVEQHPGLEALFVLHAPDQTLTSRSTSGFPAGTAE